MNLISNQFYIFAQSPDGAADKAKDILTKITTFKIAEAMATVVVTYLLIQLSSRLLFWLSERVAKEWRLRVKQFVPGSKGQGAGVSKHRDFHDHDLHDCQPSRIYTEIHLKQRRASKKWCDNTSRDQISDQEG